MEHATAGQIPASGPARPDGQPNPFFKPWIFENARRNLLGARDRFTIVGEGQRIALPLTLSRHMQGWLPTVARVWGHDHCFDMTPLTDDVCGCDLETLFGSLAQRGIDVLRWPILPMDTAFSAALVGFLREAGLACAETKRYRRPLLVPDGRDPDSFFRSHLGKKRLKDLRRRRHRLSEMGRVGFMTWRGGHDAAQWCDAFIELEASGWKGPAGTGTAIGCSPSERAFFGAMASEGAAKGRIVVHSLTLDDRPVAMTVNFRSGAWLWAYKSAYREELAHLAPGVQVEMEGSRAMLGDPALACFDSCMTSERGLLADLWPGRRPIADLLIAVHPRANRTVRAGALMWRRYLALRDRARETMGTGRRKGA